MTFAEQNDDSDSDEYDPASNVAHDIVMQEAESLTIWIRSLSLSSITKHSGYFLCCHIFIAVGNLSLYFWSILSFFFFITFVSRLVAVYRFINQCFNNGLLPLHCNVRISHTVLHLLYTLYQVERIMNNGRDYGIKIGDVSYESWMNGEINVDTVNAKTKLEKKLWQEIMEGKWKEWRSRGVAWWRNECQKRYLLGPFDEFCSHKRGCRKPFQRISLRILKESLRRRKMKKVLIITVVPIIRQGSVALGSSDPSCRR